jgi:hypothetical protein
MFNTGAELTMTGAELTNLRCRFDYVDRCRFDLIPKYGSVGRLTVFGTYVFKSKL